MSEHLTTTELATIMRARGHEVVAGAPAEITGGVADSRQAVGGSLFGAFRGEQLDGNDYVVDAIERGAVAAVCERLPADPQPGATLVRVASTIPALHELAGTWRDTCDPVVVGITGTVGKTTTKDLVAATLARAATVHRSPGNQNSREGLPLALMSLRRDHAISVLELAMDSKGEIAELVRVARPSVGVVMNIGLTHISKLGSIEAIAEEKLTLARRLCRDGTAILNADDPRVIAAREGLTGRVLCFGIASEADVRATAIDDRGLDGVAFDVTYGDSTHRARSPLMGVHVVPAALAAISCCIALGRTVAEAVEWLAAAEVDGRMRLITARGGWTILDDRYNSSPASLAGALDVLSKRDGARIALLGIMAELGQFEEQEHRALGRHAARCCDALYAVGEACRALVEEARSAGVEEVHWFEDKFEAVAATLARLQPGDHVLVKASRSQAFEELIPVLRGDTP